ncbi:MAG: response regulator transcription factor [Flavobacteriales bacterium]|nr:response regulator transcription factor [Flavobacteriales bacterium]
MKLTTQYTKEKTSLVGVTAIIADDHQLFADAIKGILLNEGMIIQGICNNGKDAYFLTLEKKPKILLTDINMPGMEGIHLCKKIKEKLPETKVIMISMYEENTIIHKSFKNGADGYISKGYPKKEMIKTIKKALKGENYINKRIVKETKEDIDDFSKIFKLTERELEVTKLILKEKSNNEISEILCCGKRTVETHRNHIMKKLGIKNTIALFKLAIKHNLIKF